MNSETLNWDIWWQSVSTKMIIQEGWRKQETTAAEASLPWTYQKYGWCTRAKSKGKSKIKKFKDIIVDLEDDEINDFEKWKRGKK